MGRARCKERMQRMIIKENADEQVLMQHEAPATEVCAYRVSVTDRHIRRALRAMEGTIADACDAIDSAGGVEGVVLAATVIAALDAFADRVPQGALAQYNLVEDAIGADQIKEYAMLTYGLFEGPEDEQQMLSPYERAVEKRLAIIKCSVALGTAGSAISAIAAS